MLECPHCYRVFRADPEKLGARCPKCRQPLFERTARRRPSENLGPCGRHPESPAVGKCKSCDRLMCVACRTRWSEEPTCPECIDRSIQSPDATPQELLRHQRHAWTGLVLAVVGWTTALLVFWPLVSLHANAGGFSSLWVHLGTFFFFSSLVPALIALGQCAAALRLRGPQRTIATCGLVGSGLQLGLMVGIVLLNLWHN
jgi:hypothetical protein